MSTFFHVHLTIFKKELNYILGKVELKLTVSHIILFYFIYIINSRFYQEVNLKLIKSKCSNRDCSTSYFSPIYCTLTNSLFTFVASVASMAFAIDMLYLGPILLKRAGINKPSSVLSVRNPGYGILWV